MIFVENSSGGGGSGCIELSRNYYSDDSSSKCCCNGGSNSGCSGNYVGDKNRECVMMEKVMAVVTMVLAEAVNSDCGGDCSDENDSD